jgi:hypothetical protein
MYRAAGGGGQVVPVYHKSVLDSIRGNSCFWPFGDQRSRRGKTSLTSAREALFSPAQWLKFILQDVSRCFIQHSLDDSRNLKLEGRLHFNAKYNCQR